MRCSAPGNAGIIQGTRLPSSFAPWACLVIALLVQASWAPSMLAEVRLPGIASSSLAPEIKGLALIEELHCAACHAADPALAARSKKAPRLADVGSRIQPAHVEAFIRDPHPVQPGTTMPDALSGLPPEERRDAARAITHFLLARGNPGFRVEAPDAVAAGHGHRLFHARGCAQCHSPRDPQGVESKPASSVPLGPLERRWSHRALVDFLARPHVARPSGRMPDMQLAPQDRERIAHFLLQDTKVPGHLAYTLYRGRVWEGLKGEDVQAEQAGHVDGFGVGILAKPQHHSAIRYEGWLIVTQAGPHAFRLTFNGGSLAVAGRTLLDIQPSPRRAPATHEAQTTLPPGRHRIQLTYFHTGYDPRFALDLEAPGLPRGPVPSSMLSTSETDVEPPPGPFHADPALVAAGRDRFARHGCARCHDDMGVTAAMSKPWTSLDPQRGCLGDASGPWPRYDLSPQQRAWMARALPRAEQPALDDATQVSKTLAALNCIACHERAGLGGRDREREVFFTGTQPALGDQGRLPPPLTGVGAKLNREWLSEVLLHGRRQRPYLDTAMPRFGEAHVRHLVEALGKVDALEEAPIPVVADIHEARAAGQALVGASGLGCIACHEFNGQPSGEASALDIARAPERLRKNWFHLYLRNPARFHPTVIMPAYWPEGRPALPQVLGGDAGRQIEAIWAYLAQGSKAPKPLGLSRESNELRVADMPELCRGQSPVGYRSIGIGYPERIHLAFDAGEMALRQLWKGEFASVSPGHFHPRGSQVVTLPPGIPFHRLAAPDEPWPRKGKSNHAFPQDHGYQFRGYHLDARRRPTLLYQFGEVGVRDLFEDRRDAQGNAFFRRTLQFESVHPPRPFHFRVAAGKTIAPKTAREWGVDALRVRIVDGPDAQVREGEASELLLPLALPPGPSSLTLEYQW